MTEDAGLRELVEQLAKADFYALDTEFHRERTYWPYLALVQVAWRDPNTGTNEVALVDPLELDVSPLSDVLAGPGTMVAHAADQDLEILHKECGLVPGRLLDTQIAAGFAGHASASLNTLSRSFLGIEVAKGDRLTDWRRRPLTASQLTYAAADVENLIALAEAVYLNLDAAGRRQWADEECESLRSRHHGPSDPNRAWWKLRDARSLRGPSRGIAQEVAAWREIRAREQDQPVRTVLPDLAIQAIAHKPPSSPEALARVRGMEGRQLRPPVAAELLMAIERGRGLDADQVLSPPVDDVPKEQRPPVALVMAWVAQIGRDEGIDTALLATRGDVAAFLRGDPDCRIATGWRSAMLAAPINALVHGDAVLAFGPDGNLLLEERSRRPFVAPAGDPVS